MKTSTRKRKWLKILRAVCGRPSPKKLDEGDGLDSQVCSGELELLSAGTKITAVKTHESWESFAKRFLGNKIHEVPAPSQLVLEQLRPGRISTSLSSRLAVTGTPPTTNRFSIVGGVRVSGAHVSLSSFSFSSSRNDS